MSNTFAMKPQPLTMRPFAAQPQPNTFAAQPQPKPKPKQQPEPQPNTFAVKPQPLTMRRAEVAQTLGVDLKTVSQWVARGIIPPPTVPAPGCPLWSREQIEAVARGGK